MGTFCMLLLSSVLRAHVLAGQSASSIFQTSNTTKRQQSQPVAHCKRPHNPASILSKPVLLHKRRSHGMPLSPNMYCMVRVLLMCLRMDVLTVRRRRWRWEGGREGGGGDSATVAVHQQRWDYSRHITLCRLEKGDGAAVECTHSTCSQRTFVLFPSGVTPEGLQKVMQPNQCTCRGWLSFAVKPFLPALVVWRAAMSANLTPAASHAARDRQTYSGLQYVCH